MAAIWLSGKIVGKDDAKISVYDHGLLYGDGVFEGIRVYSGKVFKHREHIERLYESAKSIALEIPLSFEQMIAAVEQTVKTYGEPDGYIRLIITRGPGNLGLDPRSCKPEVIIIVDSIQLYPKELYETGLEIVTASIIRNHTNAVSARVKSLNYLNNILAKMEAIRAGCLEAIMLNAQGEVSECTGDNIFIVKKGVLKTPPPSAGILEGITRNTVLELARATGTTAVETVLSRHDVYTADEVFLTGTAAEVIAVVKVDGRIVGNGKPGVMTRQLRDRFQTLVRQ